MRAGTEKKLYEKVRSKNLAVRHVCEVGVWLPEMSNILDFIIKDRLPTTLVEPDPKSIAAIKTYFRDYPNVRLLPYAAFDHNGTLDLVQRDASTFVSTLPYSPAQVNDGYHVRKEDTFSVECRRFDELDDATIDLLSVDTEGSEWYVINYLRSRPLVISVEMHGKSYLNPYYTEIASWMAREGYDKWYMDKTDIVYYKKGAFTVTAAEKRQLAWMDFYVRFRRFRKRLFGGNKSGK
jgi:FkbM family methyltransferase